MNVGWMVENVNLEDRTVTFRKGTSPEMVTAGKRRKRTPASARKPFHPPKLPTFRRRRPSETRIAKAWARLKNLERRKLSMRQYRGKFKPRPALEKRLYKPEAKPE
jgi:hypothetical protein